jgi:predicted ATP-dependent endonuclease of OLD family
MMSRSRKNYAIRFASEQESIQRLIRIDEIAAQRDFADAGEKAQDEPGGPDPVSRQFKRKLSDQLRVYYDRHLDPNKTPREEDYEALGAIQKAERSFDKRLKDGFGPGDS